MRAQSTYESCLAWCLLHLAEEEITKDKEIEIVEYSLRFTKKDFTIGHLEAVHDKFKKITLHIDADFRYECKSTAQLKNSANIHICPCDVLALMQFFDDKLLTQPVILYLDSFALWKQIHYPHYVIIIGKKDTKYTVIDPWDGKKKKVSEKVIHEGIKLLKNYLGFAPRLITTRKKSGGHTIE